MGFVKKCETFLGAGCAENKINTTVVIRFSVLRKLGFWMSFLAFGFVLEGF